MNITKEQADDLNLVVSLEIGKDDYEPKVNEVLRDYRRKANMPGFRPGKVPEGLVRKLYGKAVLVDEINKLVSESLQNYIKEQELHVLGDPMPKTMVEEQDWEIGNPFTFDFEMALAPAIDVNLSKKDRITKYQIIVDKALIDKNVENYASRYGEFVNTDCVDDFKEKLTGDIVQLDDNQKPLENELSAEDTSVLLSLIKDDEHKKPFEKAKVDDEIVFNLSETFPNDWEVASILKKKNKEEVGDISTSLFRFTIKSIQKFVNAELNQELFNKVFGDDEITSIEEFENRIKEDIAVDFEESSMVKFGRDAQKYLLEKINPAMPEEFLRKWLLSVNKDIAQEAFEKEFPLFLRNMQWELIATAIAKQKDLKVDEQEIIDYAKEAAQRQFAMYGMSNIPEDALTNYAMSTLKEEKNVRNFASQVFDRKVTAAINDDVDIAVEEISLEDFNKMIYATNESEGGEETN